MIVPVDEGASAPTVSSPDEQLEALALQIEHTQNLAVLRIGSLLWEAREVFRYRRDEGGFQGWVENRLQFGRRTAYNLIDVHQRFGMKVCNALHTLPRRTLFLLAQKDTDDEVVDQVRALLADGKVVTIEDVKKLKADLKKAKEKAKEEKAAHDATFDEAEMLRVELEKLRDQNHTLRYELNGAQPALPKQTPTLTPGPVVQASVQTLKEDTAFADVGAVEVEIEGEASEELPDVVQLPVASGDSDRLPAWFKEAVKDLPAELLDDAEWWICDYRQSLIVKNGR